MAPEPLIAGVSDVSTGYGSPQILMLMRSLQDVYRGEVVLFEPDQSERPALIQVELPFRGSIERMLTTFHPHRDPAGRIEYIMRVARALNQLRPRILVVFCTYSLPVMLKLRYRPDFVLYYSTESISAYGSFDVELNRQMAKSIDLVIFPEEHRAMRDVARCGFSGVRLAVVFNCTNAELRQSGVLDSSRRNNRLLYAGTIDRVRTLGEYFLDDRMEGFPVDLFGNISGWDSPGAFLGRLPPGARYGGYLEAPLLRLVRPKYAYSIVMWNPTDENQLYAAPNKFFESITEGVPPITAPHPQCAMLVNRYKCGIVMEDWNFSSFYEALRRGLKLVGTPAYHEMVTNCAKAVAQELAWEHQFEKVKPHLKAVTW